MTTLKEKLALLHEALADVLTEQIKGTKNDDGTIEPPTAAQLSVARQFLKDNGIDSVPTGKDAMSELLKGMPFTAAEAAKDGTKRH